MKKAYVYISVALLVSLLVIGCGHRSGNNPLGVTGGGSSGYGSAGVGSGGSIDDDGGGGSHDPALEGTWRYDEGSTYYELLTFNSNGTFYVQIYVEGTLYDSFYGTYSTNGNQMTATVEGETQTGTYLVQGNTLSVTFDGETTVYTRVS